MAVLLACAGSSCMPPEWGAEALLRPPRRAVDAVPDIAYEDVSFAGADGIVLRGWRFRARGPRGVLVYLHGIGDNRQGAIGFAKRFGPQGWDVVAYDGRAHGASGGTACTYGALEKRDLVKALDAVAADRALAIAGSKGHFDPADASPVAAAASVRVPVLLVHGEADRETRAEHSRRIEAALSGRKRLIVVPGAGHDDSLREDSVWTEIEGWLAALDLGPDR